MASNRANLDAAIRGCVLCGSMIEVPCGTCRGTYVIGKTHSCSNPRLNTSFLVVTEAGGDPFQRGPYEGRYWCSGCWLLYWSDHPECLSDEESRRRVAEESRRILLERKGLEVLYQEGDSRVVLTDRGTLVFEIKPTEGFIADEYDPERFQILARALQAIDLKEISGYQFSAKSV